MISIIVASIMFGICIGQLGTALASRRWGPAPLNTIYGFGGASILAAGVLFASIAAHAQVSLAGAPRVVDGDTLELHGVRIRLFGMDAPERDQTCGDPGSATYLCGLIATHQMVVLIANREIRCDPQDTDRYGRIVAICYVGEVDLGEAMVRAGWAVDYARYSHGAYRKAEDEARAAKKGMWAGTFVRPDEWRRGQR